MKTFLVNLERNQERLAYVTEHLAQRGIAFERIVGVDGRALSPKARRRCFAAFRSWCALGRRLTPGEIGCALSHLQIAQRMVAEQLPMALIFEDDAIVDETIHERLKEIETFLDPAKPQVVILSAHLFDGGTARGLLRNRTKHAWCTDGYVMTLPVAKIIAKVNHPVVVFADAWRRWSQRYGVEIYMCWPPVVHQEVAFETDVCTAPPRNFAGWRKWAHRLVRIPQLLFDWGYFVVTGK